MARVHSAAMADPKEELGESVEVGPFCVVGPWRMLGEGVVLPS